MINKILFFGLLLLIFMLPWEFDVRTLGINMPVINTNLEIICVLIVLLWVFDYVYNRKQFPVEKYGSLLLPIGVFLLFNFVSAVFAVKIFWALKFTLKLAGSVLIYLVVVDVINSESRIKKVFYVLFITSFIVAAIGIAERFFPETIRLALSLFSTGLAYLPQGNTLRVKSTFVYPNVFAMYLEIIILLVTGYVLSVTSKLEKSVLVIILLVLTEALVLTYSRGGMLGLYAGLFVFWLLCGKTDFLKEYKIKLEKVVLMISLVFLITTLFDAVFMLRLRNAFDVTDNPTRERFYLWLTATHILAEHPVLGVGPDNFRWVYSDKYALMSPFSSFEVVGGIPNQHTNEFFLEMFADLGLTGGLIFIWLVFRIMITQLKKIRQYKMTELQITMVSILCVFVAYFTHGLIDYFWHFQSLMLLFWICLGLNETVK
jgi:hypothetical protein